ncbi:MAG: GNAT family N-acetyltransferase [bacterium]|nr:GNAT family N-acetyltransferase [bacterium]
MDARDLAREIEPCVYRSWKARECANYDGWQLRYADGFSRRGNSVFPAEQSTISLAEKIDWCRTWYRKRALDLVVRQTPATESGLDDVLSAEGFTREGDTHVMVGEIGDRSAEFSVDGQPSLGWWNTTAALWGFDLASPTGWSAIINRIDLPAGFVSIDGAGAGLAIVDGPWMGLFEIIVAPDRRRQRLGNAISNSLLDWGRGAGARRAYLQVVGSNLAAAEFYRGLGFEQAYTYWYRRDRAT